MISKKTADLRLDETVVIDTELSAIAINSEGNNRADGKGSIALGSYSGYQPGGALNAQVDAADAFAWSALSGYRITEDLSGTFNVNPAAGLSGIRFGNEDFPTVYSRLFIDELAKIRPSMYRVDDKTYISRIDPGIPSIKTLPVVDDVLVFQPVQKDTVITLSIAEGSVRTAAGKETKSCYDELSDTVHLEYSYSDADSLSDFNSRWPNVWNKCEIENLGEIHISTTLGEGDVIVRGFSFPVKKAGLLALRMDHNYSGANKFGAVNVSNKEDKWRSWNFDIQDPTVCYGDLMSIYQKDSQTDFIPQSYGMCDIFRMCDGLLNAPDISLTSDVPADFFNALFGSCKNMVECMTDLYSRHVNAGGYTAMFSGCD